jgi:hypothetical protein
MTQLETVALTISLESSTLVSVRPRHGVGSPISGAYCLFACDAGEYSELPLCDEILRIGS